MNIFRDKETKSFITENLSFFEYEFEDKSKCEFEIENESKNEIR